MSSDEKNKNIQISLHVDVDFLENKFNKLKSEYEKEIGIKLSRGNFVKLLVDDVVNFRSQKNK